MLKLGTMAAGGSLAALLLLVALLKISGLVAASEKTITVAFRYDDMSATSPHEFEQRLIELFADFDFPLTVGIIPFVPATDIRDPEPQELVAFAPAEVPILNLAIEAGLVDLALHGFSHQTYRDCAIRGCAEFEGLEESEQRQRLRSAKAFLEEELGTRIDNFVPPWNRYDATTLSALEEEGFSGISASLLLRSSVLAGSQLRYVPYSADLPELRSVVTAARRHPDPDPTIVVLFHAYDFREVDADRSSLSLLEFRDLLDWVSSHQYLRVTSVGRLAANPDFSAETFTRNQQAHVTKRLSPFFLAYLNVLPPDGLYFSAQHLSLTNRLAYWGITLASSLLLFSLAFVMVFLVGSQVYRRTRTVGMLISVGAIVLTPLVVFRLARASLQTYDPASPIVLPAITGAALALCFLLFQRVRTRR